MEKIGGGGGREGNYNFLFNTRNLFRVSRNPSGLITFRRQKKVVNARSKSMIISSLALHQKPTLHDHYYGNTGVIYLSNMHATPIDTCCTVFRPVFCWFWQPQNANSISHETPHRWRSRAAARCFAHFLWVELINYTTSIGAINITYVYEQTRLIRLIRFRFTHVLDQRCTAAHSNNCYCISQVWMDDAYLAGWRAKRTLLLLLCLSNARSTRRLLAYKRIFALLFV